MVDLTAVAGSRERRVAEHPVAGPRTPGQRRRGLLWHGRQAGRVCLKERKLGVTKPRLRERGGGEVAVPAYAAMQENGMSTRMLDVLMRGISTREYAEVLPEMASSCGVSKSSVSREAAEAGEALKELLERRFDKIDLRVIYIDGMQFGEHHVISAVGVDRTGYKHVLARAGHAAGSDRKRGGGGRMRLWSSVGRLPFWRQRRTSAASWAGRISGNWRPS